MILVAQVTTIFIRFGREIQPCAINIAECLRRFNPPNGRIECESKRYAHLSKCFLECDPGFIPRDLTFATCLFDDETNDYFWDVPDQRLQCAQSVGLVVGGMLENLQYTSEVEVFSPGIDCTSLPPPYPLKVVGASSGFLQGQNVVCGGGHMDYDRCSKHLEGSRDCQVNLECVKTAGGARWCTGPKTDKCFSLTYDLLTNVQVTPNY